ncbi:UDP-glucose 4-epimerase GalE [Myxococcota bacterium]|nr:UDP-glucose 4-epimerase GalE [Myxococcota bacterium]MBU1537794.1 UDP-glucose 4-epimerase GalE [Myxococcota bacterium]
MSVNHPFNETRTTSVLVTGGAGYIGSHTLVELLSNGVRPIVIDNFENSSPESLRRVASLCGSEPFTLYEGDIRDSGLLDRIFSEQKIESVIHFAGLKAVGESVREPLRYYDNNVGGTVKLLEAMQAHDVQTIVFSSSATVYGDPHTTPIKEDFPRSAVNPYGRTKLMIEEILTDLHATDPKWKIALLRYFNPVGAHPSGVIGEDPNGIPNNLLPFISKVAVGQLEELSIFGDDYPTPDGTGVRDYIHVVDLARGHVHALRAFQKETVPNFLTVNLGTGRGYSVLEMVHAFERVSGKTIPYEFAARRAGDVATCFADPALANRLLGWSAQLGIEEMCRDAWNWQSKNPEGFKR